MVKQWLKSFRLSGCPIQADFGLETPTTISFGGGFRRVGKTYTLRISNDSVYYSRKLVKDHRLKCEREGMGQTVEKEVNFHYAPETYLPDGMEPETILWYGLSCFL